MRFALGVEYDGRSFSGWQTQPGGNTVQDVLQSALARIAGESVQVVCAGRTDAGVHATAQVVHFDTQCVRPLSAWVRGVNTFLPDSVAVRWVLPVAAQFHARFSAIGRSYRYLLVNRSQRPGVWNGRAGWYHLPLDVAIMQRAADLLLGEHDFSAFRAADCQARSPVKTLRKATVRQYGELVVFDFEAGAFLHHMVRNLVGSLVYVGQGKHPPEWIRDLLHSRDRRLAAPTFSAAGLYLAGVHYESLWGVPVSQDAFLANLAS